MASRRALTSDRKSKKSPVRKRRREKETAMVTFDICKGNPGALTFVMLAYEYNPYRAEAAFRRMQNNGITGDKLYMLWNDCCDRDVEQALVNMECMSMEEIGREFSGRDHSTIVYSLKTMERDMKNDQHLRETVSDIIKNVKA